jgi:hypothetical protein
MGIVYIIHKYWMMIFLAAIAGMTFNALALLDIGYIKGVAINLTFVIVLCIGEIIEIYFKYYHTRKNK